MKKLLLVTLLIGLLLLPGCSFSYTPPSADNTQKSSSDNETDDKIDNPPATEKEEKDTIYQISDSASLKDWNITVTDSKIVDSIAADYGSFRPKEEGNKFIQVFVIVDNEGKQSEYFLPSINVGNVVRAKVLYGDGYEFSASNLLGYSNDLHDSVINPLSSRTGEIVFEIPSSVAESEDELTIQFSSGNDAVKFKIR